MHKSCQGFVSQILELSEGAAHSAMNRPLSKHNDKKLIAKTVCLLSNSHLFFFVVFYGQRHPVCQVTCGVKKSNDAKLQK